MRKILGLIKNEFITGMVLLAPIAGTIWLGYAIASSIDALFPDMWRPRIHGVPLPGLGIFSVFGLALLVGVFAHNFVGQRLAQWVDRLFASMPLFGGTYGLIKQVFESVFSSGADSFKKAVLVEYPRKGMWAIAFVTSTSVGEAIEKSIGEELVSVFVPTTPNPTSGFYLLVPRADVRELAMPVDQAFKLVVSMGMAKEAEIITTTAQMRRDELDKKLN